MMFVMNNCCSKEWMVRIAISFDIINSCLTCQDNPDTDRGFHAETFNKLLV